MLRLKSDDDLFKSSTMSFGEHLEELRAALLRAILGLVAALVIAFPFADHAVRFVERPLMRSLQRFHREQAEALQSVSADGLHGLYASQFQDDRRMIPRQLQVDRVALFRDLGLAETAVAVDPTTDVRPNDVQPQLVRSVASQLVAAADDDHSDWRAVIWQSLPESSQAALRSLAQEPASSPATSDELRLLLADALRPCLTSVTLADAAFASEAFLNLKASQQQILQELFARIRDQKLDSSNQVARDSVDDRLALQRINRIALSCAFPHAIQWPRPEMISITVWEPSPAKIQTLGVPEAFIVWVKAWLVLAVLIASPWIFYQIWQFVAAGMYGHERKLVYTFLPFSLGLFLAGASLAFLFVFDPVLDFLFQFNRRLQIAIEPRLNDWLGFVLLLPLGFGVAFQLPLVMLIVERLGIVSVDAYLSRWRIAVLGIFVLSMLLTPADPISMLLMAIPLTLLYFGGIALCRTAPKHASVPPTGHDP